MSKNNTKYPVLDDEWRKKHPELCKRLQKKSKRKTKFYKLDELLYKPTMDSKEHKGIHELTLQAFEHLLNDALNYGGLTMENTLDDFHKWAQAQAVSPKDLKQKFTHQKG